MNLSPFLYGLSELIGLPAVQKLVETYGGTSLPVPKPANVDADHPLAQLIGLEAAQKLAAFRGGERITIALYTQGRHKQASRELHKNIRALREQGLSHARIARELQTTDRTVGEVLRTEVDDRQKALF